MMNTIETSLLDATVRHRTQTSLALDAVRDVLERRVDGQPWTSADVTELCRLADLIDQHIRATEDPQDGILIDIIDRSPRLAHATERLRVQHRELDGLITNVRHAAGRTDAELLAHCAHALVRAMAHHREEGAHVVFEAYDVDLGGGD